MKIKIIGVNKTGLEAIINELGSLFIDRCKPYIEDNILLFDISLSGSYRISADNATVTIDDENISTTIKRGNFFQLIIL